MKPLMTFKEMRAQAQAHPAYAAEGPILNITEAIYQRMQDLQLTKAALARRLGTSAPYITKLLNGRDNFTIATLARLSHALECDLTIALTPTPAAAVAMAPVTRQPTPRRIVKRSRNTVNA